MHLSGKEAGMGEGGVGEGFSGCNMLTVICFSFLSYFSLSIYLSLSHHNQEKKKKKKKNACTRTPKFLCIFLRNARPLLPPPPPPTHTRLHTQMVILSKVLIQASVSGGGGGGAGVGAWPPTGYRRCLNKRGDERPLNSVLQPWTLSDFFH